MNKPGFSHFRQRSGLSLFKTDEFCGRVSISEFDLNCCRFLLALRASFSYNTSINKFIFIYFMPGRQMGLAATGIFIFCG